MENRFIGGFLVSRTNVSIVRRFGGSNLPPVIRAACCTVADRMQNTRLALDATRCDLDGEALRVDGRYERQDVGMAGCQDSSQLRVTYITNDCGLWRNEKERERERERGEKGGPRAERGRGDAREHGRSSDLLVVRCSGRRIVCQAVDMPIPWLDYHILTPALLARHRLPEY